MIILPFYVSNYKYIFKGLFIKIFIEIRNIFMDNENAPVCKNLPKVNAILNIRRSHKIGK